MKQRLNQTIRTLTASFVAFQLMFGFPIAALAQGENQGANQGINQGVNQGEAQGAGQNIPEAEAPSDADISASNENTGENSENTNTVTEDGNTSETTTNTSTDTTAIAGDATTGNNTNSKNTGDAGTVTGDANIGVTQVKNDNTVVKDGNVTLSTTAQAGDVPGDLEIGIGNASSLVGQDGNVKSVKATNTSTGSGSGNTIDISTTTEELTEVQNDGTIDNSVELSANTGGNTAEKNTGDAAITTGNANASASLVNLLNTTVENGNILVSTTDVYGNVEGDIRIPDFNQLATILTGGSVAVDAENSNTGSGSTNTIDVELEEKNETNVNSTATVDTTIRTEAITGQNDSLENTGGANIETGDASVQASNISLTNTTVKDASLGVVIVNALNRFIGFLIGSDNVATPLSKEETIAYVDANNSNTGSNSDNSITVSDTHATTTNVTNNAAITNDINASAITGQNTTNKNTGKGSIATGDASITASAVNIANTTVKNGNLAVYIVNIFGNFFGNIFFGETQLALPHDTSSNIAVNAENSNTGSDSINEINVHVTRTDDTTLNNSSTIRTTFDTTLDTGNNRASRNTNGADIATGTSQLNILSRSIANTSALGSPWGNSNIDFTGTNNTTGESSANTTALDVTENFSIAINNFASVETFIPGSANTGNNELDKNTIGGAITTGLIDFNVSIGNILNRIFLALHPSNTTVAANAENILTGADSTNENTVSFTRNFLLALFNTATANTLIDLLFNTGGNTANNNTLGAAITTGSICGSGNIENNLNTIAGLQEHASAIVNNNADANTAILALANTGGNELNENTAGSSASQNEHCPPEPTPAPSTTPTPTPGPGDNGNGGDNGDNGGNGGDEQNGQGGGEDADNETGESDNVAKAEEEPERRAPRIAGAVDRILQGVGGLGLGGASKKESSPDTAFPIAPFFMGSMSVITSAAWADHRARRQKRYMLSV